MILVRDPRFRGRRGGDRRWRLPLHFLLHQGRVCHSQLVGCLVDERAALEGDSGCPLVPRPFVVAGREHVAKEDKDEVPAPELSGSLQGAARAALAGRAAGDRRRVPRDRAVAWDWWSPSSSARPWAPARRSSSTPAAMTSKYKSYKI